MDKDINAMRGGLVPYGTDAIEAARARIAPPSSAEVAALYGGGNVGMGAPAASGQTREDTRPAIKLGADPTPVNENPPELPKAPTKSAAKEQVAYETGVRYAVRFKGPVEIERDLVLSPHAVHYMDGAMVEKYKAHVDVAAEAPQ